jgi:hypothetical protein
LPSSEAITFSVTTLLYGVKRQDYNNVCQQTVTLLSPLLLKLEGEGGGDGYVKINYRITCFMLTLKQKKNLIGHADV